MGIIPTQESVKLLFKANAVEEFCRIVTKLSANWGCPPLTISHASPLLIMTKIGYNSIACLGQILLFMVGHFVYTEG